MRCSEKRFTLFGIVIEAARKRGECAPGVPFPKTVIGIDVPRWLTLRAHAGWSIDRISN